MQSYDSSVAEARDYVKIKATPESDQKHLRRSSLRTVIRSGRRDCHSFLTWSVRWSSWEILPGGCKRLTDAGFHAFSINYPYSRYHVQTNQSSTKQIAPADGLMATKEHPWVARMAIDQQPW